MSKSASGAGLALRLGLAFAFLYPPIAAVLDPYSWTGYFPAFIRALPVNELWLLHGLGIFEALLALWVLSGWRVRIPAVLMAIFLLLIVATNATQLDIVFRDLSIAAMAVALVLLPEPRPAGEASAG